MNTRDYKQFAEGQYYHVFNRGNAKANIFLDNQDYGFFLMRMRQNLFPGEDNKSRTPLPSDSFSLISYCLMPNHFHFLIRQNREIPTTKLMLRLCTSYSIYFNKKYDKVGHVFQDQYKQVVVDDNDHLVWLSAYIHQNPKVAGLVRSPEDYKWSSYVEYLGGVGDNLCDKRIVLDQFQNSQSGLMGHVRMTLTGLTESSSPVRNYKMFVDEAYGIIKEKKDLEHLLIDD